TGTVAGLERVSVQPADEPGGAALAVAPEDVVHRVGVRSARDEAGGLAGEGDALAVVADGRFAGGAVGRPRVDRFDGVGPTELAPEDVALAGRDGRKVARVGREGDRAAVAGDHRFVGSLVADDAAGRADQGGDVRR